MESPCPPGPPRIREADPPSVVEIAAISTEAFPHNAWDIKALQGEMDLEFSHCLVAERLDEGGDGEATLLGYLIYWLILDEIQILQVATRASARRHGVGRALVERCLEDGVTRGGRTFLLEVRASNLPAQSLYRGFGFRELALRRAYYSAPVEDAVIMMWRPGE